jgi:periplasmic protein TonB
MAHTTSQPPQPFSTLQPAPSARSRWFTLSIAAHAAILSLLLLHHAPILKSTQRAGALTGHNLLLTYNPGHSSPAAPERTPKPAPSPLPQLHIPTPKTPPSIAAPSILTATTPTPSTSVGTDTFGEGDIKIASVLNHPHPTPDLNALPAGTRGDVIVDIVIDPTGRIASFTLSHGLGHGIDETVLATIQHWTFQPATRNGVPVASEQELLFHYERG